MKSEFELIKKIAEVISLIPECHDFAYILQEYKKDQNTDIAYNKLTAYEAKNLLAKMELDVDEVGNGLEIIGEEELNKFDYWINIGEEFSCIAKNLRSLKKVDSWDNGRPVYMIRVNETNEKSFQTQYANTDINFFSVEDRDAEFLRVKRRLSVFTFIRFL